MKSFDQQRGVGKALKKQEKCQPLYQDRNVPVLFGDTEKNNRSPEQFYQARQGPIWRGPGTAGYYATHVRSTTLSNWKAVLDTCFHLIHIIILWSHYHYYSHFRYKEIGMQNLKARYSYQGAKPMHKLKVLDIKSHCFKWVHFSKLRYNLFPRVLKVLKRYNCRSTVGSQGNKQMGKMSQILRHPNIFPIRNRQ